ncbi:hypothetical protein B0H13DRAFT_792718 [Mycena leptocephala]|nr:hypothetical protein B0H13DRAFT_792718 [Mycena leptocephala]
MDPPRKLHSCCIESLNLGGAQSRYGTGMFSGSQHFTVTGENLTNITNNYPPAPTLPSDFRMIPLGDIDLQYDTGVIGRHREWGRPRVRRVYSAKVEGRNSNVTVAMYQGHGAEEEWQRDIARYMAVRHPNIIQVCGAASSGNIHATLFHDDMIPLEHFVDLYRHSHFSARSIFMHIVPQSSEYDRSHLVGRFADTGTVRARLLLLRFRTGLHNGNCTFWIRRSTSRLCTDLIPPNIIETVLSGLQNEVPSPQGIFSFSASNTEAAIIESLTVERYHSICSCNLKQLRLLHSSSPIVVNVGLYFPVL